MSTPALVINIVLLETVLNHSNGMWPTCDNKLILLSMCCPLSVSAIVFLSLAHVDPKQSFSWLTVYCRRCWYSQVSCKFRFHLVKVLLFTSVSKKFDFLFLGLAWRIISIAICVLEILLSLNISFFFCILFVHSVTCKLHFTSCVCFCKAQTFDGST